jgi:hypothetical protein
MKAFLRDDAATWLGWYEDGVPARKRWGRHEDLMMIDALVPDAELGEKSHVVAYQKWHNGEAPDDRQREKPRARPKAWEELKVDGVLGPKTRKQLIVDYMNLDGTTLAKNVRIVTYGCGEYFPLLGKDGEVDAQPNDGETVAFDRRVEVFFFAKPFGVLPEVPGVGKGESSKQASQGGKDDKLYLEWRRRVWRDYSIETESEGLRLRLCNYDLVPYAKRPFAFCLEGFPEVRGETDEEGFIVIDSPPSGAHGYVEVSPEDEFPEDTIRWEIDLGHVISPVTPLGASIRLRNLGYWNGEPTDEMTDELSAGITYFQTDHDGLEPTGKLDEKTCNLLRTLHDCEMGSAEATNSEEGGDGGENAQSELAPRSPETHE